MYVTMIYSMPQLFFQQIVLVQLRSLRLHVSLSFFLLTFG